MKVFTPKTSINNSLIKRGSRRQQKRVPRVSAAVSSTTNKLIQRKPICPCDGACPRCIRTIQTKLTIGQPGDQYEQEADRIADEVMRMPDPVVQKKPT